MKWFKHDSTANSDAKLKKVRIKYGMEGYGLYWYCLELVASDVDQANINFELEHDSEIISHDTGIHIERINEMMAFMCDLNLFESNGDMITCLKMAKRLDQSMTSNPQMREIIKQVKHNHDLVMTESCPDKIRLDKIRIKEKTTSPSPKADPVPFVKIIDLYHEKLKTLPRMEKLTTTRKGQIRQRWAEDLPELKNWENFFYRVSQSDFLMGKVPGNNGKPPFRATLAWITKAENFAKIAEGNYHV